MAITSPFSPEKCQIWHFLSGTVAAIQLIVGNFSSLGCDDFF